MSFDLQPLASLGEWSVLDDHIDPEGHIFAVPADEQPVVFDDDGYDRNES